MMVSCIFMKIYKLSAYHLPYYKDSCILGCLWLIVSTVQSTYGGYYGLVVVTPRPPHPPRPPRPQTLHRLCDNLKNPYRIASIFHM